MHDIMNGASMISNSGKTNLFANTDIVTYDKVVRWWSKKYFSSINELKIELEDFNILFACNSNHIEDIDVSYHTTREIFTDGKVTGFSGSFVDLMTVNNQKFASEFFMKSLMNKTPITVDFILKLHKIMLHGCYDETRWSKGERPGTIKKGDYCVGLTQEGSFPEETYSDLVELCNEVTETLALGYGSKILVVASYFHLRFEQIHPFADGNGRVGRTLMNYILMLGGYPPTIIFDDDKNTYYLALEVYDRKEDISGFIEFIKEQTVKTWWKFVR